MLIHEILILIKSILHAVMVTNLYALMINKSVQTYRGENAVYTLIKYMRKEDEYCKEIMKKLFEKNMKLNKILVNK